MLLVSIWFYSSRGQQCCLELRALIDAGAGKVCAGSPSAPPSPVWPGPAPLAPPAPLSPPSCSDVGDTPPVPGCPPVGSCLGYDGNCADLQEQFATVQGCYVYGDPGAEEEHTFLDDYGAFTAASRGCFWCSCSRTFCMQCVMPFPMTRT